MTDQWFSLFRNNIHSLDDQTQRMLFQLFRELVYRDIYFMLNDHSLTEDVIQDSFIKAMQSGSKIREDSNIRAWLKKVARNSAYDLIRKNKKYHHISDPELVNTIEEFSSENELSSQVDHAVETLIRNETLYATLSELKYEYKIVLFLHYIVGMPYREIEQELGISHSVLTQRMARARKKLADKFQKKWVRNYE
ncbi:MULTISPECIES: RNA polymerase sigma factor [unclassified Paenibacillus]|uniref:RNA polymerase sigma factor n=1 Tax=unclassified Paenibacillus TaxID=185978 RepID=UPI001C117DCD|nr:MULTISPECIES: sigma-70 family RNA polymerase sigma factor [unclassified Paenibacillus]MBU5445364.1 sigma-70 family RNA polymerase sigma factor [Paenibacillus sp. MSJ-34]CAH0122490.1 ECF RNA polymerase sigma factor SigM [Paenibacillus sp. CECT 9249]